MKRGRSIPTLSDIFTRKTKQETKPNQTQTQPTEITTTKKLTTTTKSRMKNSRGPLAGQNTGQHTLQHNPVPRGRLPLLSVDSSNASLAAGVLPNLTGRHPRLEHNYVAETRRNSQAWQHSAGFFLYMSYCCDRIAHISVNSILFMLLRNIFYK